MGIAKSLWDATIHIVWGLATIFLLGGLMIYFNIDTTPIQNLLKLNIWLMNNWIIFWSIFFVSCLHSEIKKVFKNE